MRLLAAAALALTVPAFAAPAKKTAARPGAGLKAYYALTDTRYADARSLAEPGAKAGDFLAAYVMGRLFEKGYGVAEDAAAADRWFKEAHAAAKARAEKGDAAAAFVEYQLRRDGLAGLPKERAAAMPWLRRATDAGFAPALRILGLAYQKGDLVPKDDARALELYRKASETGMSCAEDNIGLAYLQGTGVPADKSEARERFEKAFAEGCVSGARRLGDLYRMGEGIPADQAAARAWYAKAADAGVPDALSLLGYMEQNGLGGPVDKPHAMALYLRSAEAGSATGAYNTGVCYEQGVGVDVYPAAAERWYRAAARRGFKPSPPAVPTELWTRISAEVEAKRAAAVVPKPTAPAKLTAKVSFSEPSGNGMLDAFESAEVKVTVSNAGPGPAYAVKVESRYEPAVAGAEVFNLGTIEPGKEAHAVLKLNGGEDQDSRDNKLIVDVKEGNGFDAPSTVLEFKTRAFQKPKLEVAAISLGGSGVVKAGEVSKVSISIRNAGAGPAERVSAALALGSSDLFNSGEPSVALGTLAAGESKKAEFEFFVNNRFKGKALPVSLKVTESRGKFGLDQPLGLTLGEAAPSPSVVRIAGKEQPAPVVEAAPEADDVDSPPPGRAPLDPEAYAIVVGVERYRQKGLPAVDYAARDAQAVHTYLTRGMGFDEKNVILLQNEQATKADLEKYFGTWLKNRVTDKSRVFVYYAGHGAPNPATGDAYIIPYEGDPAYTADTAFPLKKLYEDLAALPAKDVLVALDACFSGQGARSVIAKGARPLVNQKDAHPDGKTVVIAATGAGQISTSYPDGQHGLLTYHLLKGLRGAAAAEDGRVTTSRLFAYLKPAVEREARRQNVEQTPTLWPPAAELGERADSLWIKVSKERR